jgi:hypothetical protein
MDKGKEHALPQHDDEADIPCDEAAAYEEHASASAGNALGTTLTIDPTGMSIIKLPLGSAPPYYTLSTSLLQVHPSSSVHVSRQDKNSEKPLALYAIAEEFISPLHGVRPAFRNVRVRRSTGIFTALGLRKVLWDFITEAPIPLKDGKIDKQATVGKTGGTAGNYFVTLGGDEVGLQEDLLRFYDGKWVDEKDEVLALAREGGRGVWRYAGAERD